MAFFAPHGAYSSSGTHGEQVREFKDMVKALHRAGIEVLLDVVYNHTPEGNELGPTLSFRGLDNALMRFNDALMAFPAVLLAIAVTAVLGPSKAAAQLGLSRQGLLKAMSRQGIEAK